MLLLRAKSVRFQKLVSRNHLRTRTKHPLGQPKYVTGGWKSGRTIVCVHTCDDVSLLTPRTCNGCSSNLLCVRSSSAWPELCFFLPSGWTVACVWRRCLACRAAVKIDVEKMNGKKKNNKVWKEGKEGNMFKTIKGNMCKTIPKK